MPQEPKRRHSRQRKGKRRASVKLSLSSGVYCTNCGSKIFAHSICKKCGFYKGKEILPVKVKKKSKK